MIPPQNQRRRDRARGSAGREDPPRGTDNDPLATLRAALQAFDSVAFAGCFSADGWIRVPRPEGDLILRGADEIARAGFELRAMLGDLSWTPSQRFLAAGQVVEEAVVRARIAGDPADEQIRVSMRVVTAFDPSGEIGSLTLWIDWAALNDPLGVDSARGAASALVAHARSQDARGLRVIQSDPGSAPPLPGPQIAEPPPRPNRSVRPAAGVLWWRQHRGTVAGSVMAVLAVAVIGWVAQNVLTSPNGTGTAGGTVARPAVTGTAGVSAQGKFGASGGADPSGSAGASSPKNGGPTGPPAPGASHVPVVVPTAPNVKPSVQRGNSYTFESDLLFKTDSTDLSDAAQAQLQELATTIRAEGVKGKVQVNGYTDSRGTDAYNRNLSMQRARAVANALSGYLAGGKVVEIEAQGFGESESFKTNDTAAGRKENRRVVVVVPISS